MDSLIAAATAAVAQNPELATLVAFVAAIVEAVAVLGILIPGTPILMAVAAAAGAAGLSMAPILLAAFAGAVIGDGISFWLGRRYGGRLRTVWPFATRPNLIGRAEAFFARFGAVSVGLARFLPVLRSTVPLVAGMAGMKWRRFAVANVLSALVWAPVHVFPAQLAGVTLDRLQASEWQMGEWQMGEWQMGEWQMGEWQMGDWQMAAQIGAVLLLAGVAVWFVHGWIVRRLTGA